MSLGNVTKALQLIQEASKSKQVKVKTPISLQEYTINPLKGKDELELRQNLVPNKPNVKITEVLYTTLYNSIDNNKNVEDDQILLLENFLKSNSSFDVLELFHGLNIATFEYIPDYEFTCVHCETVNKIDKLYYSEYKNESKTWDKDVPFYDYTIESEQELGGVKLKFTLRIPTLFDELAIVKKVIDTPRDVNNLPSFTLSTSNIERLLYITKRLSIIKQDETVTLENAHDIKLVLESIPEFIIQDTLNTYNKDISDYAPVYSCKVKCKDCEKENELMYHPVLEFITRIMM